MLAFPVKMASDVGPFKCLWLKILTAGRKINRDENTNSLNEKYHGTNGTSVTL